MKKFLFSSFLFLISFSGIFAQDFSNKGKDFWVGYGYHQAMVAGNGQEMRLYFATEGVTTITITIPSNGYTETITTGATPGISVSANIPKAGAQDVRLINESTSPENKGIHIVADKPVVAYAHIYNSSVSGATILFPTNTLGKDYYSINFTNISNTANANCFFYVVATDTGTTTVEITPSAAVLGGHATGVPFTVQLTQGQIYNVKGVQGSNSGSDLTGSRIRSLASGGSGCKRIGVFSGSGRIGIACPSAGVSSDNYMVQAFPQSAWGKNYLTTSTGGAMSRNIYRICVSNSAAQVKLNGTPITLPLINGFYYEVPITSAALRIESDLPVTVAQYITSSGNCGNGSPGDPEVIYLSPTEQNIDRVIWNATPNFAITQHYYNVIIPNGGTALSSFLLDGAPVASSLWTPHPQNGAYSYLTQSVTGGTAHIIQSDSGFNAIAYGYGSFESYGYNAGTNVRDLYQQVGVGTQYGIEPTPTICAGTPFKFKVALPYQPDSIYWNFFNAPNPPGPNLVNVTQTNPTIDSTTVIDGKTIYWYSLPTTYNFTALGSFPVRITTYAPATAGGCGSVQDIDFTLEVSATPVVAFANTTPRCVAETVQFSDATVSAKPPYLWYWDFGDPGSGGNNTSSVKNPTHLFSASGTYNVRFSSITTAGCIGDTITKQIVVAALPTAAVTASAPTVCQNAAQPTITFTGSGGSAPYTFQYNINGGTTQTITTTGTANTVTVNVPTTTVGTYTYNVTQVQNTGSALCVTGPISNVSATVVVNPFPSATIAGGTTVCQQSTGNVVTFTGSNGVLPYTFTYNINGGTAQTVSTSGGSSSVTVAVPTTTVGTFTYNLISVSEGTTGGCLNTFAPAPNTVFVVNGLPTATISGTASLCLNASPAPVVTFTGANGNAPYIFTYTINGGTPFTVNSPAGSNIATVTASTAVAGTFTYTLVSVRESSSTNCNQPQTGNAVITIYPAPVASFTGGTPACIGVPSLFNSSASTAGAGTITGYAWDFGDPASGAANTSSLQNPSHIFFSSGSYVVTLTITSSNGCMHTTTSTTSINPQPKAGFILPEVCLLDQFAQFTDTSSVAAPSTITGWLWNFGDPGSGPLNTSTVQNAQHTYNAVGNYNVQLIVTTNTGCKDTLSNQVLTINGGNPMSDFVQTSPGANCANDSVGIQNKSTIASGNITKLEIYWDNAGAPTVFDFDDNPVFNKIYNHKYPDFQSPLVRTYQVRVRAFSGGVCFSDKVTSVDVNASPKVAFAAIPPACYTATPYQITQATETGGVPGTGIFSGPGVTSAGIFDPKLVPIGVPQTIKFVYTSSAGGCKDSATQTITVLDTATARFTITPPSCQGNPTSFKDNSTAATGGSLTNTVWDFGDGTPPENHAPGSTFTHVFANTGTFTISMYTVSADGCRSTTSTQSVIVSPKPQPNFTTDKTDYCLPNAVVTFNSSSSTIVDGTQAQFTYLWDFGDPASGASNTSTLANPSHTYTAIASYNVKLTITSGAGCSYDTTIVLNKLHPKPTADFATSTPNICIGQTVTFLDRSDGKDGTLQSWSWLYGDGVGSAMVQNPPTYTYTKVGAFNVKLTVTNSFGCTGDTSKLFNVFQFPTVDAGPTLYVLEGGSTPINPIITGNGLSYLWTWNVAAPGGYLNDRTLKSPLTTPLTDVNYRLTVSAQGQCSASDTMSVIVLKDPRIPNTFSPNGDGINDYWVIKFLNTYPNAKVNVFTRTGALVFSSKGYPQPWDGNVKGKSVPVDTYYYIIEPENGKPPITGYVTIVK